MSDAVCDERREGADGVTGNAVGDAREAKQWAALLCDERSKGTDGATGIVVCAAREAKQ